jgi:hypothetical protein
LESAHESAPAAIGWNVLEYAPPGALRLTLKQRDDISRELQARAQRIADLKFALGDGAGWFDRARAAEKERDGLRAEVEQAREDMRIGAGECRVPLPEPGTDMARLLSANVLLRAERDALRAARDRALAVLDAREREGGRPDFISIASAREALKL